MLNAGTFALASAFAFLLVLLAGIMPRRAASWRAKAMGAGALFLLGAATLVSLPELSGWPAGDGPPSRFRLLAVHVQQPDKQTRDEGSVYLWAIDARDISRGIEPRAYRLPYSAPLHQTAAAAATKLGKGVAQLGEFSGSAPPAGGWLEAPGTDGQPTLSLKFYDVPDPLYPEG